MKITQKLSAVNGLAFTGAATTIVVNPWYAYDPINLPKLLMLSTSGGFFLTWLLFNKGDLSKAIRVWLFLSTAFLSILIFSMLMNSAPVYQQFWGTWGRSTGFLAYLSLVIIMLTALRLSSEATIQVIRKTLEKTGYAMTVYTLAQAMQLDPINWSQKLMIATLGNINFMSSFLGFTAISYTSRVMMEKNNLISKYFFVSLTFINLFLIWISGSIQGVAVYLAGVTLLIAFRVRRKWDFIRSLLFLSISSLFGLMIFVGTAGLGPFAFLRQETVVFRMDYWLAGVAIVKANLINGIGLDSYGDYYREYRTLEAVTRTGPQRVTNTAHNIFLDIATGSGLFAVAILIAIMVLTSLAILRALSRDSTSSDYQAIAAVWIGFIIFCLISINQIGVGVWGFIITGLINGYGKPSSSNLQKKVDKADRHPSDAIYKARGKKSDHKPDKLFLGNLIQVVLNSFSTLLMFLVAFLPNLTDIRFLTALKTPDLSNALLLTDDLGIQDFHLERLIDRLETEGRSADSLKIALVLVERNPRSFLGWLSIANNENSQTKLRIKAIQNLSSLDPRNYLLQEDIRELEDELRNGQ